MVVCFVDWKSTDVLFLFFFFLEHPGETSTKMTVFDLEGHFHIDPPFVNVDDMNKFEGLAFLN